MSNPNLVLIVVDDMGYGDFGVFNELGARTPCLDALVQESVCLTQHYAGSPACPPYQFVGFRGGWMDYFSWWIERNADRVRGMQAELEGWFEEVEAERGRLDSYRREK